MASRLGPFLKEKSPRRRRRGTARRLQAIETLEPRTLLTTYKVGTGLACDGLSALPPLLPGDVVEVQPGVYNDAAILWGSGLPGLPITIRGVGDARPVIDGTGVLVSGSLPHPRALIEVRGDNYVFEHLELRNAHNTSLNGAGLRILYGDNTVVRDCLLHDNDMGLMTYGDAGTLIDGCEIYGNGNPLDTGHRSHNLYAESVSITIQYSYIHDPLEGQNVKSRSHYTALLYNDIEGSNEGEVCLVDSPTYTAGGNNNALLVGNVIVSRPRHEGNPAKFIDFGEDMGNPHRGTLYLINNTMIAGVPSNTFLQLSAGGTKVIASNNVFYGSDKIVGWSLGTVTGTSNWVPSTASVPPGFVATTQGADPGFVDFAGGDYHLTADSPVLNLGVTGLKAVNGSGVSVPVGATREYVAPTSGQPRLVDRQPDLGAFETQSAPGLWITDAGVAEGSVGTTSIVFTVTLTPPPTSPVTVRYATADGTAQSGLDYGPTSGTLTFAAGQTVATITVPVFGDIQTLGGRSFTLALSNPQGAPLARGTATGTILEDDAPWKFDFGTATSPLADGYARATPDSEYNALTHFGWSAGSVYGYNRGTGTDLTRDYNYTRDGTFTVDLPNGTFVVTVSLGEAWGAHDRMALYLQGTQVASLSTAARQVVNKTYRVVVSNKKLTLRLKDNGGADPYAAICALTLSMVGADTTGPSVISADPGGPAPGTVDHVTLTFDEPIRDGTFTLDDIAVLSGPNGDITPTAVKKINANTYVVLFAPQTDAGVYSLAIDPFVYDLARNAMDQNGNGLNGEPEDSFTMTFTIG